MALDKELVFTVGAGAVGIVAGWWLGRSLGKTINKMKLDTLKLENRILDLELKEELRASKEAHAEKMKGWYEKIAKNQALLAELTEQTEKDLIEQAKWKEMFEKNELTPEQYFEKLSMYLP